MPEFQPNRRHESYSPARNASAITPSDSEDLSQTTRSIYVGVGGTLTVIMASGGEVSFVNVQSGSIMPLRVSRVKATGTTATNMIGLY